MSRFKSGKQLAAQGSSAEALQEFAWCLEHGVEHNPAFVGVHNTFLVTAIHDLGTQYPPAAELLSHRRALLEARILTGHTSFEEILEVASIDRVRNEPLRTLDLYHRLRDLHPDSEAVLDLWHAIIEDLYSRRFFSEIASELPATRAWLNKFGGTDELVTAFAPGRLRSEVATMAAIQYGALLAVGRRQDASSFSDEITAAHARADVFGALAHEARRANEPQELDRLLAKAQGVLSGAEFEAVQQAASAPD